MRDDLSSERIDELAEEFMDRRRRGEHSRMSEYQQKYPQLAEEIRELFPMVCAMEELKQSRERTPADQFPAGMRRIKQPCETSSTFSRVAGDKNRNTFTIAVRIALANTEAGC